MKMPASSLSGLFLVLMAVMVFVLPGCSKQQDIDTHMRNALLYEKEGKIKAAVIELKNVIQQDANHRDARLLLGQLYLRAGDGASAEKELSRAIDLGVSRGAVSLELVQANIMQGKYKQALENISVDKGWPEDKKARAEIMRGDAHLGVGNIDKALSAYRQAMSLDKSNSSAAIGLAKVSFRQQNLKQAEEQLSGIEESDENAIDMLLLKAAIARQESRNEDVEKLYERALEISRQRNLGTQALNIQSQLVVAQIINNKIESALDNTNQLLKAVPQSPFVKYLRGLIAYQQKDYDTVFTNLLDVLSKVPEHLPSSLLLGASSYATGNYQQANVYLTEFVNKVPTHIHARKLLGVVRLRLNKPDEAVEVLKSVSQSEQKGDGQLLAIIGQAVTASGDTKAGIKYLQQARKAQPESDSIRAELAKVYLSEGAYDKAISELEGISGEGKNKAKVLQVYSLLRKEDFSSARKKAAELLNSEPDNPAWLVVAGGVEMISGDRLKARNYFNKAIAIKDDFAQARINLARLEAEDGNLEAAQEQFDKILHSNDKHLTALLGMAQLAERYGRADEAVSWLEKARQADPRSLVPRLVLGRYYFKTGNYTESLSIAREMAEVKSDDVKVLRLMAASLIKLNRSSEALETYKKVIANDTDNPQWHFEMANIHRGMKNNNLATAELKKALTLDKNFLPAKAGLVELDILADNLDEAVKGATSLKNQYPKSSAGYLLLGDIYTKQKDLKKAQQTYIDGYKVSPSLTLVNKIFLVGGALKNYDEPIRILKDWLKKHPDDPVAGMYLGLSYQAIGKFDLSENEYSKVLNRQPNNIMALNNMAYLLIEKDGKRAMEFADRARQLAPDNFAILDTYGWVLTKNGMSQEGLEVLQKALDKSQGNLSIRYHYAVALDANNQRSKAVSELTDITQAGKEFPELEEARKLLKKIK